MKNRRIINIFFSLFLSILAFSALKAQINNIIIVKVGNLLVTSVDVQNEIITNLLLNKKEITQESINSSKSYAIKNLINKRIKKIEVNKYEVKDYNKGDLKRYTDNIAKQLNTNVDGLKKKFKKNHISYDTFVENYQVELLWNTLIFRIYKNQTNVNIIEVENEVLKLAGADRIEYNLSEIEISNLNKNKDILNEILELINMKGFEVAAKKYSQANTADKGGYIGWVEKKTLSPSYLVQIEKLDINEISALIINKNSSTIIKLNEIKRKDNKIAEDELKKQILSKKKEEKLSLFSRSHFTNLENSISINFL
ncbi:peptidylprolyl isomerase [Pelagibacteraceae bacterium]|nr:peptidylprolyl isomerase [Pelagibacteraceae bacterium]